VEHAVEPVGEGMLCLTIACGPEETEHCGNVGINGEDDAGESPAAAGSRPAQRWEIMAHEKIHYPRHGIELELLLNLIDQAAQRETEEKEEGAEKDRGNAGGQKKGRGASGQEISDAGREPVEKDADCDELQVWAARLWHRGLQHNND